MNGNRGASPMLGIRHAQARKNVAVGHLAIGNEYDGMHEVFAPQKLDALHFGLVRKSQPLVARSALAAFPATMEPPAQRSRGGCPVPLIDAPTQR